jgi:hypothetical protein
MLLREEEKCFAKSPRFTNKKEGFYFPSLGLLARFYKSKKIKKINLSG